MAQSKKPAVKRDRWDRFEHRGAHVNNRVLIEATKPLTVSEIEGRSEDLARVMSITPRGGVYEHLKHLEWQGLVESVGNGKWQVTTLGRHVWEGKKPCPPRKPK